ncbi:MAG: hypothetical protein ABJJ37_20450, partial [Roseibium sp.]
MELTLPRLLSPTPVETPKPTAREIKGLGLRLLVQIAGGNAAKFELPQRTIAHDTLELRTKFIALDVKNSQRRQSAR